MHRYVKLKQRGQLPSVQAKLMDEWLHQMRSLEVRTPTTSGEAEVATPAPTESGLPRMLAINTPLGARIPRFAEWHKNPENPRVQAKLLHTAPEPKPLRSAKRKATEAEGRWVGA